MNAISYSLFGYGTQHDQSLNFKSYLRGLHLNIRVAELLYPGWKVCVMADESVCTSPYGHYLLHLNNTGKIDLIKTPTAELCRMMLYRLYPLFIIADGKLQYERVLCRDADSLLSYRERQAVEYWIQGSKMAHAMTDSVSHNIPLMGGMIGFCSGPFRERMGVRSFDDLMKLSSGIDYNCKGADQDFLNRYILPKVADSITEHFVLGHPQTFRGDCHNFIHDIDLNEIGVPEACKDLNGFGYHIGAAGFQTDHVVRWLQHWGKDNAYWADIEKQYSDIFYWWL
ncbi:MAG: hypothetical protein DIU61_009690 [Bacteroidota bacterium]